MSCTTQEELALEQLMDIVKRCKQLELWCGELVNSDYKIDELKNDIDSMSHELMSICLPFYEMDGVTLKEVTE